MMPPERQEVKTMLTPAQHYSPLDDRLDRLAELALRVSSATDAIQRATDRIAGACPTEDALVDNRTLSDAPRSVYAKLDTLIENMEHGMAALDEATARLDVAV